MSIFQTPRNGFAASCPAGKPRTSGSYRLTGPENDPQIPSIKGTRRCVPRTPFQLRRKTRSWHRHSPLRRVRDKWQLSQSRRNCGNVRVSTSSFAENARRQLDATQDEKSDRFLATSSRRSSNDYVQVRIYLDNNCYRYFCSNKLYLHGGWTGNAEMGDFWEYEIETNQWKLLSINTSEQNGPSPRCCHKLVVDSTTGTIYILGRYVDHIGKRKSRIPNDFYKYEIRLNKWTTISEDVEKEGGPPLTYDHQMVFSEKTGELLCFGGRVLQRTTRIEDFSLDELQPQSPIRSNYGSFYKWVSLNFA